MSFASLVSSTFLTIGPQAWDVGATMVSMSPGSDYVQLWNPYSASYALTRSMLEEFRGLPEWSLSYMFEESNPLGMDVREVSSAPKGGGEVEPDSYAFLSLCLHHRWRRLG